MSKYLIYNIESLENIKFSKTNMQKDAEQTMEYIPGSAIRGAYIYKYIVANNMIDINGGEHRQKLLNGKIKFLNAYPIYNGKRSIPFPKSYFAEKQKIKLRNQNLQVVSGLDKSLDSNYDKVRGPEFALYENGKIFSINIEKNSNLHINKTRGKEENKLFRYESMIKNQNFQGIIKVEDENLIDEIKSLFENEIVYLGGSKGSGYGKCKIKEIMVVDDNPEIQAIKDADKIQKEIYIMAMSDIIYSNEVGECMTYIDEEEIKKRLNLEEVEFLDSTIETKNITNFNNKWNASTPNINSIKAGSVFKYRITGDLNKELLEKFIDEGLGERKLDGFGRFIVLSNIKEGLLIRDTSIEKQGDNKEIQGNLNSRDKKLLQNVVNNIYKNRLEKDISRIIIDLDSKLENKENMNMNQWGKLLGLFSLLYNENYINGKEKWEKYFTHIRNRRSVAYDQLSKVKYKSLDENKSLLKFIDEFIENSKDIQKLQDRSNVKVVEINEFKSEIDNEFAYKYNMKILRELCRYQIRKGEIQ